MTDICVRIIVHRGGMVDSRAAELTVSGLDELAHFRKVLTDDWKYLDGHYSAVQFKAYKHGKVEESLKIV